MNKLGIGAALLGMVIAVAGYNKYSGDLKDPSKVEKPAHC
jgi:hypothetical protein